MSAPPRWVGRLLWIDGTGGAAVGVLMLVLAGWLSERYRLPRSFLLFVGVANLAYGCYALSLARRAVRPMALVVALAVANLSWAVLCGFWVLRFHASAHALGLAHLALEGVYVGGLGAVEWRWRGALQRAAWPMP